MEQNMNKVEESMVSTKPDYTGEIIAIIRKAQRDGVDVESDLRCRLRDIESEIEHIEKTMNHE